MGHPKVFSTWFGAVLVFLFLAGFAAPIPGQTSWVRFEPVRAAYAQAASPVSQIPAHTEINLQEVGTRLWNQASFQYVYDRWLPEDDSWHAWGTVVGAPRSWAVYSNVGENQFMLGVIRMEDRYWWGLEGVNWQSFTEAEVSSNQADETTLLAWWLLTTTDLEIHDLFLDQTAVLTGDVVTIEDVPCYHYTWQQAEDGIDGSLYLDTATLLPVQIEHRQGDDVALCVQFHHFNDPASVVWSPVQTPELTMSDVRMALNTMPVFHWAAHWTVLPEQPGIEQASLDLANDGIYSLSDHAQWVWTHLEQGEDSSSATLFILWQEGDANAWASTDGYSPWLKWSTELDAMFSAFYLWTMNIHVAGTLVSPEVLDSEGFACREYLFVQPGTPDPETPTITQDLELRMCVTEEQVPVHAQLRVTIQNVGTGQALTFLEGEWLMARMGDSDDTQTVQRAIQGLPSDAASSFPQVGITNPIVIPMATESPWPTEAPK